MVVVAIDGNPAFDALEGLEHPRAIDHQIADDGKLARRAAVRFPAGLSSSSRSTSAEQACRTRPLMTIVQAPQTSSRQLQSQATGATCVPSTVVAMAAIRCSTLITFMSRSYGTRNRSQ